MHISSLFYRLRAAFAALAALSLVAAAGPPPAQKTPQAFATPEAAVDALASAMRDGDVDMLRKLFGAQGLHDVSAGDKTANDEQRRKFTAAYDAKHAIGVTGEEATLSLGPDDWPFPIPLHHGPDGWSFDVAAGREEILDRRIGGNELFTQQVALAYVDAQNEYAAHPRDGRKLRAYARKFFSDPGRQDGLYWPTAEGETPSPLGPLVAGAHAGGYRPGEGKPAPYHGYYYRILTAQGPHASGGAYDYMARGLLLGGFGLVAWPAEWGRTGVTTFVINQDGKLYGRDLGPDTASIAKAMTRYDPGPGWTKIGEPEPLPGLADSAQ